jgi:hypothetical protein
MNINNVIRGEEKALLRLKESEESIGKRISYIEKRILYLKEVEDEIKNYKIDIDNFYTTNVDVDFYTTNEFRTNSLNLLNNNKITLFYNEDECYFIIKEDKYKIILDIDLYSYFDANYILNIIKGGKEEIKNFANKFYKEMSIKDILE